jgi:hypothetical protein
LLVEYFEYLDKIRILALSRVGMIIEVVNEEFMAIKKHHPFPDGA